MNIFRIRTSAWSEEDFTLFTQLSEHQVRSVIQPMVEEERAQDFVYSNEEYVSALFNKYPKAVILTDLEPYHELQF